MGSQGGRDPSPGPERADLFHKGRGGLVPGLSKGEARVIALSPRMIDFERVMIGLCIRTQRTPVMADWSLWESWGDLLHP